MYHVQEHAAVNRRVVGSSPTGGASCPVREIWPDFLFYVLYGATYIFSIFISRLKESVCYIEVFHFEK